MQAVKQIIGVEKPIHSEDTLKVVDAVVANADVASSSVRAAPKNQVEAGSFVGKIVDAVGAHVGKVMSSS